jgi:glycosyltransferase involved in cell wall biosynthesis
MDFVGEMLLEHLAPHATTVTPIGVLPTFRHRASRLPFAPRGPALTIDRGLNRLVDYPKSLARLPATDLLHVIDHSYSHLLNARPDASALITCHDLDAFRCILRPAEEPRSLAFRWMTSRLLGGFRRAAHVACDTSAVRDEVLEYGLMPSDRVSVVHNGVHPTCVPYPSREADAGRDALLGPESGSGPFLMHVGTTISRKNVEFLLRVLARVRATVPGVGLLRVGGPLTAAQQRLATDLRLDDRIIQLPFLSRSVLASFYRLAALVLQPSLREGFGLPVAEAMACGTPVIASRIPVLEEVGGLAASYCSPTDETEWAEVATRLLRERDAEPQRWKARQQASMDRAARFSWAENARRIVALYERIYDERHGSAATSRAGFL